MTEKKNTTKKPLYVEPAAYFPKDIRDAVFGKETKKKTTPKKTTTKKK